MENTEYQTTLALRENITFDEKVDIEELVLPSEQTGTPNMENKDIKKEPMEPQISSTHSSRSVFQSFHSENEHFHDEMEKDIAKLFEELDMMSRYKHDQMRVRKVKQLVEKYQRIDPKEQVNITEMTLEKNLEAKTTELNKLREDFQKTQHEFYVKSNQMSIENNSLKKKVMEITEEHKVAMSLNSKTMNSIIKMHEKALEDNTNGLKKVREELQVTETNNMAFSKRIIHELELASKQFSSESPKEEATDAKKTPARTPKRILKGGLQLEDLKVGNGPEATGKKIVGMYYKGKLMNNDKVFDSCLRGKPFNFRLGAGEVIKGLDVGIVGMKVGGKRRLTIPPAMAYGAKGASPDIPANSHVVFEVE
jgi:FK506-binding nuclear protein